MVATLPGTESHPHAAAVLGGALPPEGRPSHAYLFHGPAGTGKRSVAREFAAALLSEGSADPAGAAERVRRGSHPDLTWVCPAGSEIRVEEIDQPVVSAAARTPFEARRRVFILEGAHAMTEAAANRMLKTLEEPPAFAHLLLLTDRPGEVLETIASRCQQVRFDPLTVDAMAALLEAAGVEPREARACAALALGDGERARALATEEGRALRARAQELATAALDGELAARPWAALVQEAGREGERAVAQVSEAAAAEQEFLSTKDRRRHERETTERARRAGRRATTGALDHVLQLTGLWFRDLACVAEGASELALNADRAEELARAAQGRPPARLRNAVELVEDTRQRLVLNVAHELACEALTYRLARELAAS